MPITTTPAGIATGATIDVVRRRLARGRADARGAAFASVVAGALGLSVLVLAVLVVDVVTGGWSVLSGRFGPFLSGTLGSQPETSGLSQGLRGSLFIGLSVVVFAFPLGVAAAVYLEEYAPRSRLTRAIDVNIRNLAGVPSVVYGILGFSIFVRALGGITGPGSANGRTVVSAGLTLAVLVLPIVIITSSEAIRAVPSGIREAGYALGASSWEVVRHHVLPFAAPGILTGTVLSLARALGEAAPLILVGATTGFLSGGDSYALGALGDRFTALPMIVYTWAGRPDAGFRALTAAAIVVLLVVVLLANGAAILLRNRFEARRDPR